MVERTFLDCLVYPPQLLKQNQIDWVAQDIVLSDFVYIQEQRFQNVSSAACSSV